MAAVLTAGTLVAASGEGPLTVPYVSGIANGNMAVVVVGARDDDADIACSTAGWVQVGGDATDGAEIRLTVWEHPYATGDPAPEFTAAGAVSGGIFGLPLRATGHNTSVRIDGTPTVAAGDSQTMTAASMNTVTADALAVACYISSNDVAHTTPGNSGTLLTNQLSNVDSQCAISVVTKTIASPAATGAFTLQQATSARYQWGTVTFAIRPAAAVSAPTVDAGADVASHTVSTAFTRTATENSNGATITSRAWTIQSGPTGVGSTIGTAAALSWTPTVTGTYVLRYSATNSAGTGTDDMQIVVVAAAGGGGQARTRGFLSLL